MASISEEDFCRVALFVDNQFLKDLKNKYEEDVRIDWLINQLTTEDDRVDVYVVIKVPLLPMDASQGLSSYLSHLRRIASVIEYYDIIDLHKIYWQTISYAIIRGNYDTAILVTNRIYENDVEAVENLQKIVDVEIVTLPDSHPFKEEYSENAERKIVNIFEMLENGRLATI